MLFDFGDSEYEVEIYCSRCGSTDVITESILGIIGFSQCRKCGFKRDRKIERAV